MTIKETYESFNKEGFEEWALSRDLGIEPYSFNPDFKDVYDYDDIETQMAWECWKASFVSLAKLVVGKDIRPQEVTK